MKIDAVGVSSSNFDETVKFYSILGFDFGDYDQESDHIEAKNGGIRLMVDSEDLVTKLLREKPMPGNTSVFAVLYNSVDELNKVAEVLKTNGFIFVKEPWNAFWGQRYAIVEDPDGYRVDLFASLNN